MNRAVITIKDIADALGLSTSTVSRALQDSYKISGPVRKRVNDYAKLHNYRPNLMAQSLKNRKSRCIGVSLSSIPNNFFAEVISGIESVAYEKGYKIILTQNFESYQREVTNIEHLSWYAADGLLVSLSAETTDLSHIKKVHQNGMPIVFFDRVSNQIKTHKVVADNRGGAYKATAHLLEQGFNNIAIISSSKELSMAIERFEGYEAALAAKGLVPDEAYIKYCPHGEMLLEEVETAIRELLDMGNPPDAIITASDRITINTISILKKFGIHIPDQMAIAGFSNFSSPEIIEPALTTIKQPAFEMGKKAIELLIHLIESKRPVSRFEKIVLPTELQIRKSSLFPNN